MHICECKDLMKRENENSHAARVRRNGERVQKYLALKTAEKTGTQSQKPRSNKMKKDTHEKSLHSQYAIPSGENYS